MVLKKTLLVLPSRWVDQTRFIRRWVRLFLNETVGGPRPIDRTMEFVEKKYTLKVVALIFACAGATDDIVSEIPRVVVARRCKGEAVNDHTAQRACRLFEAEVVIGCEYLQPRVAYKAAGETMKKCFMGIQFSHIQECGALLDNGLLAGVYKALYVCVVLYLQIGFGLGEKLLNIRGRGREIVVDLFGCVGGHLIGCLSNGGVPQILH